MSSAGGMAGSLSGEEVIVVVVFFVFVVVVSVVVGETVLDMTDPLMMAVKVIVVPQQYPALVPATVMVAASPSAPTTVAGSLLAV